MDESFLIAAISMPPIENVQKMECEPAALPPMENVQKMECEPAALPPVENPQQLSEEEISGGNVWNAVTMSRIQSVIMESLKYAFARILHQSPPIFFCCLPSRRTTDPRG